MALANFSDDFAAGAPGAVVATGNWASTSVAPNRFTFQTGTWNSQGALQEAGVAVAGLLYGAGATNAPTTANQRAKCFVALGTQAGAAPYVEVRLRWDTTNNRYVSAQVFQDHTDILRNGVIIGTLTYAQTYTGWQGWVQLEVNYDNIRFWWENVVFSGTPNFARTPDLEVLDLVQNGVFNWGIRALYSGIDSWTGQDISQIAPTTPSISVKTDQNTQNLVPVTLTATSFTSGDPAAYHFATRWQIDIVAGDFNPPRIDSETDTQNLTQRTFFLPGVTTFIARVSYQDNSLNWSPWSASFSFTTIAAFTPGASPPPTLPPTVYPVLSVKPSYVFVEGYQSQTLVSPGESGIERRRAKISTPKRTFNIKYNTLSQTDADLLWAFYLTVNGKFTAFQFTHPLSGVVIPVRFQEDILNRELFEVALYNVGLSLIECFTPDNTNIVP